MGENRSKREENRHKMGEKAPKRGIKDPRGGPEGPPLGIMPPFLPSVRDADPAAKNDLKCPPNDRLRVVFLTLLIPVRPYGGPP